LGLAGPYGGLAGLTTDDQSRVTGPELTGLIGQLPPELADRTDLRTPSITDSQLTGQLPAELGNLSSLTRPEISGGQLDGVIPSELGNLTNLRELSLEPRRHSMGVTLGGCSRLITPAKVQSWSRPVNLRRDLSLSMSWVLCLLGAGDGSLACRRSGYRAYTEEKFDQVSSRLEL
jgi:hypothetical protein